MFSKINPFEKVAPTKASIVRILIILTIITLVEVGFALWLLIWNPEMYESSATVKWSYRIFMIVMSLGKAFFIVAEFMHMWYEKKQFVFYTLITVVLLFWFIVSLLWEGDYFLDNRNDLNRYQSVEQVSDQ